jgi:peptidyl-prolyl cis-trans isomerase C
MGRESLRIGFSLALLVAWIAFPTQTAAQTSTKANRSVLAVVNGKNITQEDLDRVYLFRNVPAKLQPKVRGEFIESLIDSELMQQYLKAQKITVSPDELAQKVKQVKALLPAGISGEGDLKKSGFTEQVLREELSLPLKWRNYVLKTVTDEQIEQHFKANQIRFDGTELRASQIFLFVESMADSQQVAEGLAKLKKIRQEIVDGLPFADAAKKYSDSPTREKGGDVGYFLFEGKVSPQLAKVAFSLPKGEISQPFAGARGVHLCVVTERKDGELSLEDVRSQVIEELSKEIWTSKLKELKAKAKLEKSA